LNDYLTWNEIVVYRKYDLHTTFENNPIKQRNISLEVRFDDER